MRRPEHRAIASRRRTHAVASSAMREAIRITGSVRRRMKFVDKPRYRAKRCVVKARTGNGEAKHKAEAMVAGASTTALPMLISDAKTRAHEIAEDTCT